MGASQPNTPNISRRASLNGLSRKPIQNALGIYPFEYNNLAGRAFRIFTFLILLYSYLITNYSLFGVVFATMGVQDGGRGVWEFGCLRSDPEKDRNKGPNFGGGGRGDRR
eukprot:1318619-Amorphochlora_amoeboformis.AAC.2